MANKMVAYSESEMVASKAEWTAYEEAVYLADWKDFSLVAKMAGVMESNMAGKTVAQMDNKSVVHMAVTREFPMVGC